MAKRPAQRPVRIRSRALERGGSNRVWTFFCPLCRMARKLLFSPQPDWLRHGIPVALSAVVFCMLTWPFFGFRGLSSILPIWVVFEMSYRLWVRKKLVCPHCGFDAVLYQVDVKRCRQDVEEFWKDRRPVSLTGPKADS